MEKRFILSILIFLFAFNFINVSALDELEGTLDKIDSNLKKAEQFTEKDKWDYLGAEWQKIFLSQPIVKQIDGFLNRLDPLFFVFIAKEYSFSLIFFILILFWLIFFSLFYNIFRAFSPFSKLVSFFICLILVVVTSHLGVYESLAEFTFSLVFFSEGIWGWISYILFILFLFLFLSSVKKVIYSIGLLFKKTDEERKLWEMKFKMEANVVQLEQLNKKIEKGFKK